MAMKINYSYKFKFTQAVKYSLETNKILEFNPIKMVIYLSMIIDSSIIKISIFHNKYNKK